MLWLGQFKDSLIIILLVAVVLSAILGEVTDATDAIVIFVIVLFATTPHFELYENGDISLVILNLIVPAYTHLVLPQVTVYRSHVLGQVNRVT